MQGRSPAVLGTLTGPLTTTLTEIHAKAWQENNPAHDTVPPVTLGASQLDELHNLRIVDHGRRYARVYRAGELKQSTITAIATQLAVAGVQEARFYSESYELLESWTAQLPSLKAAAEEKKSAEPETKTTRKNHDSQSDALRPHVESRTDGVFWVEPKQDRDSGEVINRESWLCSPLDVIGIGTDGAEPVLFYVLPAPFKNEVARGFNKDTVARILSDSGMLRKPGNGKGWQIKTPRLKHLNNAQLGLYLKRGKNTISSIVKTYAPSSDGNNVDAYIQALSRKTGLDPNAVIPAGDTQTMVNLMKGIIDHENGGNYLSKSDISRAINGGMNYDPVQYLSGYGAPVVSSTSSHSGGTINQTNHYSITAGGVDADGLVRRIKQEQSEDIHQALNMTKTDKF